MTGRMICTASAVSASEAQTDLTLDVSGVASGPYILCIESEGQTMSAQTVAVGPQ
ncbi:MAG: hypothetical protein NTX15_07665 [Candidatus Kapabacteria bacterium]|nr:hypothetical protein [Candidatus Kapabacteria bacterium]